MVFKVFKVFRVFELFKVFKVFRVFRVFELFKVFRVFRCAAVAPRRLDSSPDTPTAAECLSFVSPAKLSAALAPACSGKTA